MCSLFAYFFCRVCSGKKDPSCSLFDLKTCSQTYFLALFGLGLDNSFIFLGILCVPYPHSPRNRQIGEKRNNKKAFV